MIQVPFRHVVPASLLMVAVLVATTTSGAVLGAEAEPGGEATVSPEPSSVATAAPASSLAELDLRIDLVIDGLDSPVYLTDDGAGGSCLYIVERGGIVRIASPVDGFVSDKPFLDISKLVRVGPEQGLHAIAFHPDFKTNGRLFAHYNDSKTGASVIAEFKGSGKPCRSVKSKPVKPLRLSEEQPFPNNNGGWIGFGPDGYLYVALGDGGGLSPGDPTGIGQSKSTRLSKILRLDVDRGRGAIAPKTNPYAKKKRGFDPLTYAWGLRDPRRASFDRKTGDLWIGDVGQNRYEEVNRIPAGKTENDGEAINFGWSDMEGEQCHNLPDCDPAAYQAPVHFYDKVPPNNGITGGYVYRGESIPDLQGTYLFSDVSSGLIWGLDADAVAAGEPAIAYQLLDAPVGIVSFGEDDDGELYAVASDGSIYRIELEGG